MPESGKPRLLERRERRPVELRERRVAGVTDVLHAHGCGVETARGEVAELREELRGGGRVGSGLRGAADVIRDGFLLRLVERRESLAETTLRFRLDPLETGQYEFTIGALLRIRRADPLVDEFDDAHRRCRRRNLVG